LKKDSVSHPRELFAVNIFILNTQSFQLQVMSKFQCAFDMLIFCPPTFYSVLLETSNGSI